MPKTIAIAVIDLMFQPRIEAAVRALGFDACIADTPTTAESALGVMPAMLVVDLHADTLEPLALIGRATTLGVRVLAFGRHTEPGTLRAARDAGAEAAVPRSQLVEDLEHLISSIAGAPAG